MTAAKSWSLLDPRPQLVKVSSVDDYIVYWNGIVMPHSMALCIAMQALGIYPSPEMRRHMESNYEQLYFAGAFNTRAWDQRVINGLLYPYLSRIMEPHVAKTTQGLDPKVVLGWFSYDRARTEENTQS